MNLTDQFGVIRHHGKIQWPGQLHRTLRHSLLRPGLNADALAQSEFVSLRWRGAGTLRAGVQRLARVYMQVSEKGLLQGRNCVAGFSCFQLEFWIYNGLFRHHRC